MCPYVHHPRDEVIHVLEGEFSFVSGEGTLTLGPGCVVFRLPRDGARLEGQWGRAGQVPAAPHAARTLEWFLEEVGVPVTDGASLATNDSHPRMDTDADEVPESARRNGIELLITPL